MFQVIRYLLVHEIKLVSSRLRFALQISHATQRKDLTLSYLQKYYDEYKNLSYFLLSASWGGGGGEQLIVCLTPMEI